MTDSLPSPPCDVPGAAPRRQARRLPLNPAALSSGWVPPLPARRPGSAYGRPLCWASHSTGKACRDPPRRGASDICRGISQYVDGTNAVCGSGRGLDRRRACLFRHMRMKCLGAFLMPSGCGNRPRIDLPHLQPGGMMSVRSGIGKAGRQGAPPIGFGWRPATG